MALIAVSVPFDAATAQDDTAQIAMAQAGKNRSITPISGGFHERLQILGFDGANAIIGNGALTAGIRRDSGLCILSWPYPSNHDQLDYISFDVLNGTIDPVPEGRPYRKNMGSFLGVRVDGAISWLTDGSWQSTQRYLSNETAVLVTQCRNEELGIAVEVTDLVLTDSDVMARDFRVTNTGPARRIELVYYENLNPTMAENKFDLIKSTINEEKYDYAVEYNQSGGNLLHYNPEGVYFAIGSSATPSRYHCGVEGDTSDAFDAENNGLTYDHGSAKGKTNAILAFDLGDVAHDDSRELPVYLAVGPTEHEATRLLDEARKRPFQTSVDETNAYWGEWIGRADLSGITDVLVRNVIKRGLITIKMSQSKETGGIVASPCRQTAYNYCWPRDTWPIVLSLDRLGYTDEAQRAIEFFKTSQQPDGHWTINSWCNGSATVDDSFGVEATAIMVITPYEHYRYTGDMEWLGSMWPMMRGAADWLSKNRDPITHVQQRSSEGDYFLPVCQSILGAACSCRALRVASEVARLLGYDDPAIRSWNTRADEIERSIDPVFWLGTENRYAEFVNFPMIGLDGSLHIRTEGLDALCGVLKNPFSGLPVLFHYVSSQAKSCLRVFDRNAPGTAFLRNTEYNGYNGPIVTWISEPTKVLPYDDPRVVSSADAAWEFYSHAITDPGRISGGVTVCIYGGEIWTYPLAWTNYYFAVAGQKDPVARERSELMIRFMAENLHDTLLIPDSFGMQYGRWTPMTSVTITLSTSWYIATVLEHYGV